MVIWHLYLLTFFYMLPVLYNINLYFEVEMNKSEFINILSKKLECSKTHTSKVVDMVFECIGDSLKEEDVLRFVGFGTFKIQRLPKRQVKTPRSGEIVTVPAKKYVRFSSGELLKNKVNK